MGKVLTATPPWRDREGAEDADLRTVMERGIGVSDGTNARPGGGVLEFYSF